MSKEKAIEYIKRAMDCIDELPFSDNGMLAFYDLELQLNKWRIEYEKWFRNIIQVYSFNSQRYEEFRIKNISISGWALLGFSIELFKEEIMNIKNYKRAEQILSTISKLDDLKDCIDKFDDADWGFNYKAIFNHNFSEITTDKEFVSRFKDFIEKEKQVLNEEFEEL